MTIHTFWNVMQNIRSAKGDLCATISMEWDPFVWFQLIKHWNTLIGFESILFYVHCEIFFQLFGILHWTLSFYFHSKTPINFQLTFSAFDKNKLQGIAHKESELKLLLKENMMQSCLMYVFTSWILSSEEWSVLLFAFVSTQ